MGWGIEFEIEIYLSREDYGENKFQVEDKIEELKNAREVISSLIRMYAASSIEKILPKEWEEEPLDWLNNQIGLLEESYKEITIHIYKLRLYIEFLEEKK